VLSAPKRGVWFDPPEPNHAPPPSGLVALDSRTRMVYSDHYVFINGESFRAAGDDAQAMQALADTRKLTSEELKIMSHEARVLLNEWLEAGWLRGA
jgi:50S ribosomal protein L16 3-hydroxylase